jgi:hypothetical protein
MAAVAAGTVNPADLLVTRVITVAPEPGSDTAVFTANRADYDIAINANGRVVVTQVTLAPGQRVSDGTDIVRNMEKLQFADQSLNLVVPNAPTNVVATASTGANANGSASLTWIRAADNGGPPVTSQEIVVTPVGGTPLPAITDIGPNVQQRANIGGLTNGTAYTFQVRAVNDVGPGPLSAPSAPVTPRGLPAAPTIGTAVRGNQQATVSWTAASDGGSPITGYNVQVRIAGTVVNTVPFAGTATTQTVTGLTNGTAYTFRVQAVNAFGPGAVSAASNAVTPATVPNAPTITGATSGVTTDAAVSASVNWSTPDSGGSAITSYTIRAIRMQADGVTPVAGGTVTVPGIGPNAARPRSVTGLVSGASYRFEVLAVNALGTSAPSAQSALVTAL